jgi:serine phosphatase RsbU (regulator of sigma subunit)
MVSTDRLVTRPSDFTGPGWQGAPCPAVLAAADGTAVAFNDSAGELFAQLSTGDALAGVVPDWLVDGHLRELSGAGGPVHGLVSGRSFAAHPVGHEGRAVTWWLVEDTEVRSAQEALRVARDRTALLGEVSTALLSVLNPQRCMQVTAQLAAKHLADVGLVIGAGGRQELVTAVCVHGEQPTAGRLEADPTELPGLSEALQGFPPVPSQWIDPGLAPDWLIPAGLGEIGSIVVTPLPGHGVPAGALVLLRRSSEPAFSGDEESFARLFAARAGAAMSAARMYANQASVTETLMRELLPPEVHEINGVEFAGRYRPSEDTDRVGGDFYDVHPPTDELDQAAGAPLTGTGEITAVLGDVCGKGLEAAVLTGKVRTTLHALLPLAGDHELMLGLLNNALLNADHTRFVTLALASASREQGGVALRLTSAGHLPPLIIRAGGEVREADTSGTLIGVLPNIRMTTARIKLAPGEACVLYTDGITEARGGPLGEEMFGEQRLREALTRCAGLPAEAIAEHVHMLADQWVNGGGHDDMAVLVIAAPRGQHLSAVGGSRTGRYTA